LPVAEDGSDPVRAIRFIVWVTLLASAALIGFVIYAVVYLGGPACWGTSLSLCRS
jgi:hypothetical protein